MSIISEHLAEINSKKLEKILLDAIKGENTLLKTEESKEYTIENLYKWYINECEEAFISPNTNSRNV